MSDPPLVTVAGGPLPLLAPAEAVASRAMMLGFAAKKMALTEAKNDDGDEPGGRGTLYGDSWRFTNAIGLCTPSSKLPPVK